MRQPKPRRPSVPLLEQEPWASEIQKWCDAWEQPELVDRVRVASSSRMRVTLGCYVARVREIRIADFVFEGPAPLLREVLAHEFAHAAVHARFQVRRRPHGREWRACMLRVGLEPRVRIPRSELDRLLPPSASRRVGWRHRCAVCRAERIGGRPMKSWRCVRCVSSGRSGRLDIERLGGVKATP